MIYIPNPSEVEVELCRRDFLRFVRKIYPAFETQNFHGHYYGLLNMFANNEIKKLIVTMPPQHGKSMAASKLLPAYLLGINPDLNICIASYAFSLAKKFNAGIQRIIDSKAYQDIFPGTRLKGMKGDYKNELYVRNSDEFDIVNRNGNLKTVGRESSLTGNTVDVMILDDLYKDAMEANSPIIRQNAWEWYVSVVKSRLDNDARELITFTRWHEEDIVGRIEAVENVADAGQMTAEQIKQWKGWIKVNFPALKTGAPCAIDPRNEGEPLWPQKHSLESLTAKKQLDMLAFEALYQGNPSSADSRLYPEFNTYFTLPEEIKYSANYTDTADSGSDKLCSVCYVVDQHNHCYITDVFYSDEAMETSEGKVAGMLDRNRVLKAYVESNNGGRGFARILDSLVALTKIITFHQSQNKEARILSNAYSVNKFIIMPHDWKSRWSDFARDIISFKRTVKKNRFDDAPDVLTGIVEMECFPRKTGKKSIKEVRFTM